MEGGVSAEDCKEALTLVLGFPLLWPKGGPGAKVVLRSDNSPDRPLFHGLERTEPLTGALGEATYCGNHPYCLEGSGHMAPGCGACCEVCHRDPGHMLDSGR